MTTLVVPDIHNKVDVAQRIIDDHPAEQRVFLGDIYDDFGDSIDRIENAARWHKEQLADPRNTFLLGNHDMPYAFEGNPLLRCSGYAEAKRWAINEILEPADWAKSELCVWVEGWLLSHAGLHPALLNDECALDADCKAAIRAAKQFSTHRLIGAGFARGGRQSIGGMTWLDWDHEFMPFPGIKQIVGHTPGELPRQNGDNWCLDTHLAHAGILRNGELELFPTKQARHVIKLLV